VNAITVEKILEVVNDLQSMNDEGFMDFFRKFERSQTPLMVFLSATSVREELNDSEQDLLYSNVLTAWEAIRRNAQRLEKVGIKEIDGCDREIASYMEKEAGQESFPASVTQPFLVEFLRTRTMTPGDDYPDVREEQTSVVFFTSQAALHCLLNAAF